MIIRRIASALRRQDWAAVLIELLIMLDQLRAGLIADAETLQQAIQRRERIEAAAVNLLKHLHGREPYQASLDEDFGALYGVSTFFLERGGYESIKSKGLDLFSNPALRRQVVVMFEDVYPKLELYNQFERSTVLDLMRPIFLEQFADLRFNQSATPLDYAALLDDTFFINLIDYRLAVIRQGEMPFFVDARTQVLQLIERIDAELGGKAEAVPGGAEACEAMTVTQNIKGAKSPNRICSVATRSFRFEDGDLVADLKTVNGRRSYRRLQRAESFRSDD